MAQLLAIRTDNPQSRLIARAVQALQDGGLIAYPTDSCYALGARMGANDALERMRAIRGIDDRHHLTLMCRDLSDFGTYARVDNARYRLIKSLTPGSYTFILQATHALPRRVLHVSRKTIGVRISDHPVARALLGALGEPMLSTTLTLPGDHLPLDDAVAIHQRLGNRLDLVIDSGACGVEPTTVIDLSADEMQVVRSGKGRIPAP